MSRGLSAAAKAYTGPVLWAVKLTLKDGTVKYYAEDKITFGGQSYEGLLRVPSGVRQTRGLGADSVELELLNATLVPTGVAKTLRFEGAAGILSKLFLGLDLGVEWMAGRIQEEEHGEEAIAVRLVSELDPAERQVAARPYQNICPWWFSKLPCGYDRASAAFTENLAEQTADIFSISTIGKASLAMTVDEHKDRTVVLTAGTGRGQKRRIKSNTATTLSLYGRWKTKPDGTTKFKVFTLTSGAPKVLFTSATGKLETTATSGAARSITDTGLAMTVDEHKGEVVRITSGTGAAQERKVGSNTATAITIDAAEADFSPAPDATSVFRVFFAVCPKDLDDSCENRARVEDFGGFPTVVKRLQGRFGAGAGEFEVGDQGAL